MPTPLVDWLDRALVSGHVTSGALLLRGPLDAFPFRHGEGRFQALFGVDSAILDYQERWPRLEETTAEVMFLNESLDVRVYDARLLDSRVLGARMHLPDLKDVRRIGIEGEVRGPFSDTFRILRETPLADRQARYIKGMSAGGESLVEIQFALPIKQGESHSVDGTVRWDGAELDLGDWGVVLGELQGELRFDQDGIYSDGLGARLWGQRLAIELDTPSVGSKGPSRTLIRTGLRLDPARLARHYPHWLWDRVQGSAAATLLLDLEHASAERAELSLRYRLESDLEGIAVELPAPIGKSPTESRHLFAVGSLPLPGDSVLQVGYGDIVASLRLAESNGALAITGGDILVGSETPPPPGGEGFRVTGHLQHLDLAEWRDWVARTDVGGDSRYDGLPSPSRRANLRIDSLALGDMRLTDATLGLVRTPSAWEMELESDQMQGTVRLPDDTRSAPISARLATWRLSLPSWGSQRDAAGTDAWPDPRAAPGLFLHVDQLLIDGKPFGNLQLKAVPVAEGLRLEELRLEAPLLSLRGSGRWSGDARGQRTALALQASSSDLAGLVQALGFTATIADADMTGTAELDWSAPPSRVDLSNLAGTVEFQVGEGRVLEVDPGVGRLFGLLNLSALQRRLTLDFSDLFGKGYAFDRITGGFTIGGGNAHTEGVLVEGPSADLQIRGRTGLLAKDYDQIVTVTPEVSVALPLAGALAGGPVVGAALLVAEQVMGDEVNKLIRLQYQVTGAWSDPDISRIQTQDGWSLSNILRPSGAAEQVPDGDVEAQNEEAESHLFQH
jgi:uncharacterized protein (TIGR02099 family)